MTLAQRRAHLVVWLALGYLLALGLWWAWSVRPPAPSESGGMAGSPTEART